MPIEWPSFYVNLFKEKTTEYNKPLVLVFVDFQKALDTTEMHEILEFLDFLFVCSQNVFLQLRGISETQAIGKMGSNNLLNMEPWNFFLGKLIMLVV